MENKIKRFVYLSKEFTIDGKEIYKEFTNTHYGSVGNTGYIISVSGIPEKVKSQVEVLEENLAKILDKAKRYEEYLELRTLLSNFYSAKDKLN